MIHTLRGARTQARRIAVVDIPRTATNRLGSIRNAYPYISMVTITDEPPSTAAQWLPSIAAAQSQAAETTPGTLSYTPAPNVAPPVVPRWNSWAGPCNPTYDQFTNAGSQVSLPVDSAAAYQGGEGFWWWVVAGLGGLASAAYLLRGK
jgi:hypothetical protein